MTAKRGRRLVLLGLAVVIVAGFGYLVYGGIGENLVYFVTPTELLAKGAGAEGAPVRLGGQVVPGSVTWNAEAIDLRFLMTDGAKQIEVHSRKAPPQMFREGMGVVVEGKLAPGGVFESDNLMVKHSNEYKAPHEGAPPQETYKSLVR